MISTESKYIIIATDPDIVVRFCSCKEQAELDAKEFAKDSPDKIYIVYKAIYAVVGVSSFSLKEVLFP